MSCAVLFPYTHCIKSVQLYPENHYSVSTEELLDIWYKPKVMKS